MHWCVYATANFKNGKAAGVDGITIEMLKYGKEGEQMHVKDKLVSMGSRENTTKAIIYLFTGKLRMVIDKNIRKESLCCIKRSLESV